MDDQGNEGDEIILLAFRQIEWYLVLSLIKVRVELTYLKLLFFSVVFPKVLKA